MWLYTEEHAAEFPSTTGTANNVNVGKRMRVSCQLQADATCHLLVKGWDCLFHWCGQKRRLVRRQPALPGSSLASSAVFPSSMSKSMSRTVLRSWLRGTEEGGDAGLDKGLMPRLHFSDAPARGYYLALCFESARRNQCHALVSSSAGKTVNCTWGSRGTAWT